MAFEVKKLDKRNNGHGEFKYYIKATYFNLPPTVGDAADQFHVLREWAWQTWGPSKELDEWMKVIHRDITVCQNEHWAWQNDDYYRRLYLRTDAELVVFKLRWE